MNRLFINTFIKAGEFDILNGEGDGTFDQVRTGATGLFQGFYGVCLVAGYVVAVLSLIIALIIIIVKSKNPSLRTEQKSKIVEILFLVVFLFSAASIVGTLVKVFESL